MKTRDHNSRYVCFYADLLERIHLDMVSAILPHDEIARDSEEIQVRARCEGLHFLTKVLPALGKSIDVSLASGTPLKTTGFKLAAETQLPRFMNGLFRVVFRDDGVPWFATWSADEAGSKRTTSRVERAAELAGTNVLYRQLQRSLDGYRDVHDATLDLMPFAGLRALMEVGLTSQEVDRITLTQGDEDTPLLSDEELNSRREAMVVALRAMRQVCFSFYKLKLPYTHEQSEKVLTDFVETDAALDFDPAKLNSRDGIVLRHARRLICLVLANADPRSGIPRHGPGAVATGESQDRKHHFGRFYQRLDSFFKYDEWFYCNSSHVESELSSSRGFLSALDSSKEYGTAKVVLVPKDSRGPRLISAEPLEYQWVQQALMRVLVDTIEKHPMTRGLVNFTDQTINRSWALTSSRDYSRVTLDLKEASDRVSLELVRALFPEEWFKALYASRTPETRMPDGRIVTFKKFAPMGSAVCFPVEALIFWALSVSTLEVTRNLRQREAATKVHVYGDDIIVDATYHGVISSSLPMFGLMLNESKCCVAGPFKESCGMDAFYGRPVNPTRVSATWCESPEPGMIASYVEYSNAFYRSGHLESAQFLEECVQWVLSTHRMALVPTVSSGQPSCIAFVREEGISRLLAKNRELGIKVRKHRSKNGPDYQRLEVQGYRLETKSKMTTSYGWPFLLRKLAELEAKNQGKHQPDAPGAITLPTGQYPIAHRVRLKRAWTPLH